MPPLTLSPNRRPSAGHDFSLEAVTTVGRKLPSRAILHAKGGWGKTSLAAQIANRIFLMAGDEDGLLTLMQAGQLPSDIPHFPRPAQTDIEIRMALNELIVKDHPHKVLVGDSLTTMEQIFHRKVCEDKFKGDWDSFWAFDRGPKAAAAEWEQIFPLFDSLRNKGIGIFLLAHSRVVNFKNPDGPDYDRWMAGLSKYSWERLYNWADMVLFGSFETFVDKAQRGKSDAETKGKARGGDTRIIHTEWRATHDAKHRHGLPPEIECGNSPQEAWSNFTKALKPK
jgi:hypothetical protein